MSVDNLVNKALKRIGNVHPIIKQGAEEIIRRAYKEGIYVLFSDGYRSNAEQNKLYAQGRTTSGNIVTNARGGQSLHNYGLAIDMFITNKAGTSATWPVAKLRKVAQIAKGLGFEWGGDWKTFKDNPHLQMTGGLSISQLQAGQKPKIALKTGGTSTVKPSKPQTNPTTSSNKTLGLVDWMKSQKMDSSFNNRKKLASQHGISNYKGTAAQNNSLLAKLKGGSSGSSSSSSSKKYPLPTGVLRRGSTGNGVKQLQRALNAANFNVGAVDGIYGAKTEDAVRRFQSVYDAYNVDGDYGNRTRTRLDKQVN